jgi:SAM-dependent methyltransferase
MSDTTRPPSKPEVGWFNPLAAFLGPAYLKNAFTYGTAQEVEFLVDALELAPGSRVLDVGCGPGRHARALGERGIDVTGIDLSPDFIELARQNAPDATFRVQDVRDLDDVAEYDALYCLCQGGFGLLGGADDERVLANFARALKPGGTLAVTAFSSYFVVRHLETGDDFDLATGVNHERATLRNEQSREQTFDLWTTCFTPRELRLLAERAGLDVEGVYGVTPGRYERKLPVTFDDHELLLVARAGSRLQDPARIADNGA